MGGAKPSPAHADQPSEKDAELAQKLGQLQLFMAVSPQECMGQLASFWANITPFSLQYQSALLPHESLGSVEPELSLDEREFASGMLTHGGQGDHPGPLASRLQRIPTHLLLRAWDRMKVTYLCPSPG